MKLHVQGPSHSKVTEQLAEMNDSVNPASQDDQNRLVQYAQEGDANRLEVMLSQNEGRVKKDILAEALQAAADGGHYHCCRLLLHADADPDLPCPTCAAPHSTASQHGATPIVLAAARGHARVVRLVARSCRVDEPTVRLSYTALHWAANNGHHACCHTLVQAGANPDCKSDQGRTPIMLAARNAEYDVITALQSAGADVTALDNDNENALHYAARVGAARCCRRLLAAGCDVNQASRAGATPLIQAAKAGHEEIVALLCEGVSTRECLGASGPQRGNVDLLARERGLSALHWAAHRGHVPVLRALLEAGLPPDVITVDAFCGGELLVVPGITALMLAARGGHLDCVETLVGAGASLRQMDSDGRTALIYAIHSNMVESVDRLLDLGSNPDGEYIPLIASNWTDEIDIGELSDDDDDGLEFDDDDDDPDSQTPRRISPLFIALNRKRHAIVFMLLRAGCDLSISERSPRGDVVGPLEMALYIKDLVTAYALLVAGVSVINPIALLAPLDVLLRDNAMIGVDVIRRLLPPRSLKEITRVTIRHHMGSHVRTDIHELPLPKLLLKYVDFHEFDSLKI